MFRFLTIDDDTDLLKVLLDDLLEWFPGCYRESATTVEEGLQLIRNAVSHRWSYDAAILDFGLPLQEIDESLCRVIQAKMNTTLVIHFTGYADKPEVLKHLETYHEGRSDPRSILVRKDDVHWEENLEKKLKARIYGDLIEQQIEDLFGSRSRAAHAGLNMRTHRPSSERTSITMALSILFGTIVAHWGDIDEGQKERIRQTFHVDESKTPIQITMPS